MTATLMTVGEALAVFLAADGQRLESATRFRRIVSGSEVNVAAGFVRMGHRARLVTRVGDDPLGDGVAAALEELGIEAHVTRSGRPTGVIARDLAGPDGGRAVHLRDRAAATEITPDDVEAAWVADVDAVFVTGITTVRSQSARAAVRRLVDLGRANGAVIVVDPNIRTALGSTDDYRDALASIRGQADVAIGDPEELAVLAGTGPAAAVDELLAHGCRLVVTKLGADGAVATDGSDRIHVPSLADSIVDTVGAGDAFAAGLIAGIVEHRPLAEALDLAARVAARVVASAGDIAGIPRRADLPEGTRL